MNFEYAKEVIEYSEEVLKQRDLDEIEKEEYKKAIGVYNDQIINQN